MLRPVRAVLAVGYMLGMGTGERVSEVVSVPPSLLQVAMGTAAPDALWAVLLLPLLVFGVPTEEPTSGETVASHAPGHCRRCCDSDSEDHLAPADAADVSSVSPSTLPYVFPEVRPYINITILKGEYPHMALVGLAWAGTRRAWGSLPGPGGVRPEGSSSCSPGLGSGPRHPESPLVLTEPQGWYLVIPPSHFADGGAEPLRGEELSWGHTVVSQSRDLSLESPQGHPTPQPVVDWCLRPSCL